jgi:predicted transcriptional regulator
MRSILVQIDEPTYRALSKIAPAAKRRRSRFIREAVRKALLDAEYERIRQAYLAQPDSADDADDWSSAEEYKP